MSKNPLFRMKRSAKIGTYTFVMGVIVLAALIVLNLLVSALPAKATIFDLTNLGITEISDETEQFVSTLDEDITIYWLCEDAIVDDQVRLLLTRYEEASSRIRVEIVDPLTSPTFTSKYTEETLSDFSFIVESARRYRVIDATELYYYTNDFVTQYFYSGREVPLTAEELTEIISTYGAYYDISSYPTYQYFQGESLLTSAIDYVTKEAIPHAYLLTGHGDTMPSDTLLETMNLMNISVEELSLQNATAVPDDANCLILYAPNNDISEREATLIKAYLDRGGSIVMTTAPVNVAECPNIMSIGAYFGLSGLEGMVREGDLDYTAGSSADILVPTVNSEHYAAAYVNQSGYTPRMPRAHAIAIADSLPSGVTVTPIFTTSETANRVSLADTSQAISEKGEHHIAVSATRNFINADGQELTCELIWFGSTAAFTDEQAENTSGGNYYYLTTTISWVSEAFTSAFEALSPVSLTGEVLSELTLGNVLVIGVIIVLVLPITLLVTGIVIWAKRRRR